LRSSFYNRKLKRLVTLELKVGEFKPEYKGQMELYLRWLDKHEREDGEGQRSANHRNRPGQADCVPLRVSGPPCQLPTRPSRRFGSFLPDCTA
jgi:hypothetical protein